MIERTYDTMARDAKGPMVPPPQISDRVTSAVAEAVGSWPDVIATAHWDLYDSARVDGIDFYVGDAELGHIHLGGSIHLATDPGLGKSLVAQRLATRFPYAYGWVQRLGSIGATQAME